MSNGDSSNRRETIHVSLGSQFANAVSAHYLNLQGLAATSNACDAHVTHAKENEYLVPRCVFFDEGETQESMIYDQNKIFEATHPSLPIYSQHANALAYSKYSRYRVEPLESAKNGYASSSSNTRHVDWGEEEEEEEEDDRMDRLRQENLEKEKWDETKYNVQQKLESRWIFSNEDYELTEATQALQISPEAPEKEALLSWDSFFAPPYPSNFRFALPFSSQSKLFDSWDTYTMGSSTRLSQDWKEDVLEESMRLILEDCDNVQGVTIATEGHGIYAGLTTTLLQYLREESRSAGTLILNMTEPLLPHKQVEPHRGEGLDVTRLRRYIETGLASFETGQIADVIVPIQIFENNSSGESTNTFHTTSQVAMALETATLAYRRNINSGCTAGSLPFQNSSRLSFGEFLASLKPSPCYKLVGLDFTRTKTLSFLLPGTSVERRQKQKTKQLAAGQQNVLPGEWIEKKLTSLSTNDNSRCSEHTHWSLSTSIRSTSSSSLLDDLECTKESMGFRFRPVISMSTILDQSIHELTVDGYAAGAYWKVDPKEATVSVLSNSTKSYNYAKDVAHDLKQGLSHKFKAFYTRDAMNGVLPEIEDCEEALEYCLSLRDTYQPPDGSGLYEDDEGVYFDDNLA